MDLVAGSVEEPESLPETVLLSQTKLPSLKGSPECLKYVRRRRRAWDIPLISHQGFGTGIGMANKGKAFDTTSK